MNQFFDLMTLFKNIQVLKVKLRGQALDGRNDEEDWNIEALLESCSNVKGLDFDDNYSNIEFNVLQSIGHRLQYLVLHDHKEHFAFSENAKKIDFPNLRQLWQLSCSDDAIRIILKTAVNLEKVRLSREFDMMEDILTKCKKLKYLEMDAVLWREFRECMGNLIRSLEKSLHRECFKIRINTQFSAIHGTNYIVVIEKLNRIINILSKNQMDQWLLILNLRRYHLINRDDTEENTIIHGLRQGLLADTTVVEESEHISVLIRNPGGAICGWRESWFSEL